MVHRESRVGGGLAAISRRARRRQSRREVGNVPLPRRLYRTNTGRGRPRRRLHRRASDQREAPEYRAGFPRKAIHAQTLRVEEREVAQQDRVHPGLQGWLLGDVRLPREGERLGGGEVQGPLRKALEKDQYRNRRLSSTTSTTRSSGRVLPIAQLPHEVFRDVESHF